MTKQGCPAISVAFVVAVALALVIPPSLPAQTQPHAGQVSRVIPQVAIQRGGQSQSAAESAPVYWQDVVVTQQLARARISLDDGSILNVGSDSSLTITKHDSGKQQTQIDLTYGKIRSNAVHLSKPKASFEVHSPVGTAGVVGTDFFLSFENAVLRLIVFEGAVRFCNLAGACVTVGQGQMSAIRSSDQPPDAPVPAPNVDVTEAISSTSIGGSGADTGQKVPPHHSTWFYVGLGLLAVVPPAVLIPVLTTRTTKPNCRINPKAAGC